MENMKKLHTLKIKESIGATYMIGYAGEGQSMEHLILQTQLVVRAVNVIPEIHHAIEAAPHLRVSVYGGRSLTSPYRDEANITFYPAP